MRCDAGKTNEYPIQHSIAHLYWSSCAILLYSPYASSLSLLVVFLLLFIARRALAEADPPFGESLNDQARVRSEPPNLSHRDVRAQFENLSRERSRESESVFMFVIARRRT